MIAAAGVLLAVAVLFAAVGISIYRGNTKLIISYHQEKVTPEARKAYGRGFGKTMLVMAGALVISGVIALFGDARAVKIAAFSVLAAGFVLFIVLLVIVQRKYNGGMF